MIDNATPHPDPLPQGGRESTPGRNDNRLVSRFKSIAIMLVVAIGAFYAGSLAEFQLGGFAPNWAKSLLFYTPPKSNIDYRALDEVFTTIQQHYVKPNADGVKLTEGAAGGMVGALGDQFSRYLTPEEYRANQIFLNGQFAGIGASVQQKTDQIVITSVLPGTPAEKAGLQVGDVITAVDGQSTKGWTADTAVNRIRGQANTQVKIEVNRNGQTMTFNLTRQEISVPSVATHIFDNRVLYIRIFDFGNRTATEFDNALKNNLKGSVNLVLLNEYSASASEITAGAIKDYGRGTLVGVKSFGKGSVQEDFLLRDGDLHLTIAYWLTPKRHSIEKTGITPDKTVTLASAQDEYAVEQSPNDFAKDLQLTAALAMLEA